MTATIVWRAHVETRNFTFDGYGDSEDEALLALRRAWRAHCREYDVSMTWEDLFVDVTTNWFALGQGYRDDEPLGPGASGMTGQG